MSMVCSLRKPKGDVFTPSMDRSHNINMSPYLRRESTVVNLSNDNSTVENIVKRYSLSSWNKLRRHTAWWKRLWCHILKQSTPTSSLGPTELKEAEEIRIHYIQRSSYPVEVVSLEAVTPLPKNPHFSP
ncbi:unnamed protein product [Allacma fusca]|uniref:Uncharacterized protein n=1 Tax=Allacma fusca TaxID=39272 RepID=A0A8J2PH49_9HEXA|nr:unnamed protein product [Allacma fusca]